MQEQVWSAHTFMHMYRQSEVLKAQIQWNGYSVIEMLPGTVHGNEVCVRAQRTRERENEKTILNYKKGEKYVGKKKKKEQMPGKQRFYFLEGKYEMESVNSS